MATVIVIPVDFTTVGSGGGGGGGGATRLDQLTDVNPTLSPTIGQIFEFNGTYWTSVNASTGATNNTIITVTAFISAGTNITVVVPTSTGQYTTSGTTTNLGSSSSLFVSTDSIQIVRNGLTQEKGIDVVWVSSTSFNFALSPLDPGEIVEVFS